MVLNRIPDYALATAEIPSLDNASVCCVPGDV